MKSLLLPLLAVIALPSAVNATNYVECEAIYQVAIRQRRLWRESSFSEEKYKESYNRAMKDFEKRNCYYY